MSKVTPLRLRFTICSGLIAHTSSIVDLLPILLVLVETTAAIEIPLMSTFRFLLFSHCDVRAGGQLTFWDDQAKVWREGPGSKDALTGDDLTGESCSCGVWSDLALPQLRELLRLNLPHHTQCLCVRFVSPRILG